MQSKEARDLRMKWGNKPCDHPHVDREYDRQFHTGDEVCTQCGRVIEKDKDGKPIPSK
jgi:hypothetical protein